MGWARPAAVAAGAAVVGFGLATQTSKFAREHSANAGERYWDRQFEGKDRSATDYYGGSAVFEFLGGLGLAAGGVLLLAKSTSLGRAALGGAAIAAAGALVGISVGSFSGFDRGKEASVEKHGVNIESQVDRLMRNFDRNTDGALATSSEGLPEYLFKYEVRVPREGFETETKWASIEKFVKAADTNGDSKADRQEIVAKLKSFDGNGDGLISSNDAERLTTAGLEHRVVEEQLLETDPWGAYIPVKW